MTKLFQVQVSIIYKTSLNGIHEHLTVEATSPRIAINKTLQRYRLLANWERIRVEVTR